MNYLKSYNKSRGNGGLTIIELLVVMTIATVIITSLVIQHNKWNDQLVVNTQNYELAMMIRQAQVYSLGVREDTGNTSATADKFNISYGIYFDQDNTRYIFFADRDNNTLYDLGEEVEIKTLARGVTIKDVCGNTKCIFTGGGPIQKALVLFARPNLGANLRFLNNGNQSVDSEPLMVSLQSPSGNKVFTVRVRANGQIEII